MAFKLSTEELLLFAIMFALSIVFTLLSMGQKEIHFKLFAAVSWFVFGIVHFIVGDKTSGLTLGLASLWSGLGLLFTVWSVSDFFRQKKEKLWSFEDD